MTVLSKELREDMKNPIWRWRSRSIFQNNQPDSTLQLVEGRWVVLVWKGPSTGRSRWKYSKRTVASLRPSRVCDETWLSRWYLPSRYWPLWVIQRRDESLLVMMLEPFFVFSSSSDLFRIWKRKPWNTNLYLLKAFPYWHGPMTEQGNEMTRLGGRK